MSGATFALTVNMVLALLVAGTFLVIYRTHFGRPGIGWFGLSYAIGAVTAVSELLILTSARWPFFEAMSYITYSLAFHVMAKGLATYYDVRLSRWMLPLSFIGSLLLRAAIWGGTRDTLPYEFFFQLPFAIITGLGALIIVLGSERRPYDSLLAGMFGIVSVHFLIKPFTAVLSGSGVTARDYAHSLYALISQSVTTVLMVGAALSLLLVVLRDMLEIARRDADIDALSGLYNRRGFDREAKRILQVAATRRHACVIGLFDLDQFKAMNDTYGHAAGDEVIQSFSKTLQSLVPDGSVVARAGGDEFAVLLPGRKAAEAASLAETLRLNFADLSFHEFIDGPRVTVSGGMTVSRPNEGLGALLARSDRALYVAKSQGRDRIVLES